MKKKKLTFSQRRKLRKLIKTSPSAENKFLNSLLALFQKELLSKIDDDNNIYDIERLLDNIDFAGLDRFIKRLDKDILKRNRTGYENIMLTLSRGLTEQGVEKKKTKKFEKAVLALTKEKEIFQPLIEKFNSNMKLIKDLPSDMKQVLRKQYLKGEALRGTQAAKLLEEKLKSRARLIIRTESSKLNSALTEVRAKAVGIQGYEWSTSGDSRVRGSHAMMDGVLVLWDDPPTLDGMTGHAGEFPNDRCTGLPIFSLDDIHFPVKVARNVVIESKYDKSIHAYKSRLVRGSLKSYTKDQFMKEFTF